MADCELSILAGKALFHKRLKKIPSGEGPKVLPANGRWKEWIVGVRNALGFWVLKASLHYPGLSHVGTTRSHTANHRSPFSNQLMFRHPHLMLFTPGIIRSPNFKPNGVFSTRLRNEDSLARVRYIDPGDNENLLRDPFVDQDPVSFTHRDPRFSLASHNHNRKLALPI